MAKINFPNFRKLNSIQLNKLNPNIPWSKMNPGKIPWNKIPVHMIPLHVIPVKKIGNLLSKIIPKKDIKSSEKILNYIRIYTHIVNAYDLLNTITFQRAFDHMIIVKNVTKTIKYPEEKRYIEQIQKIMGDILRKKATIIRRLRKYQASDPAHAKTNLLLAQNICILRILNVSM